MFDESSPRPENLTSETIELSENQRTTAAEILNLLNKHVTSGSTKRLLIFLESFSGAGKSALLKSLNPQLESLNAKILEPTPGQSSSIAITQLTQIHRFKGNLVFPVLPQNLMAERKNLSQNPNLEFAQVSLKFMSKSEIIQLLEKSGVKPLLPMEKIAEYSLGIPGLAIKIASHADTDAAALMIVVNHFKGQIKQKDSVNKLKELTTGESQLSLDALSQINQDYNILSYLNRILENSERLGLINTEVSPYFVAPESVALYSSKAEIKEITYDIGSVIMAYNISPNILPEFENSFLPDSYTQTTRRLRMFGAECHKSRGFRLQHHVCYCPLWVYASARRPRYFTYTQT